MLCPECNLSQTKVIDSRGGKRNIRRRRQCLSCHYRFTTYEKLEPPKIRVAKRSGTTEPYQRDKIAKGMRLALEKRPLGTKDVENIIDEVEAEVVQLRLKTISTKQIGDIIIRKLKAIDEVAYLRFLSVYKSFGSAKKFQKEAEKLREDKE